MFFMGVQLSAYRVAWEHLKKLNLKMLLLIISKKTLAVKMIHGLCRNP